MLINSIGGSAWRRDGSLMKSMAQRPLWDWGLLHFPSDILPLRQFRRVLPVILEAAVPNALREPRAFGMPQRSPGAPTSPTNCKSSKPDGSQSSCCGLAR